MTKPPMRVSILCCSPSLMALVMATAMAALQCAAAHAAPVDTTELSLEELLKVEVTTASRKSQQVNDIAAAVFVITRDDIQRSGATTIPEVLRMAPGVNVARMAANRYAVSVRGFNGRFANKLLVLMDGRSIYSPLFSGVLWEFEDTMLENVERIEVIRGPGGALWGANAVNAVINIITRKSRDTTGTLLVAGSASSEHVFGAFSYGGTFGRASADSDGSTDSGALTNGHFRIWAQANSQEPSINMIGTKANDDARTSRAGFRADWTLNSGNRLMFSGGAYSTKAGDRWFLPSLTSPLGVQPTIVAEQGHGAHLLTRHEWALAGSSEAALQAYISYGGLQVSDIIREQRTTTDIDFQHRTIGDAHDFIWGMGYRYSPDRINARGAFKILPESTSFSIASAFLQDEWTLVPDRFRIIGGLRIERNSFTGATPLPSMRFIWTPSAEQSIWGAVSRANRTQSRGERDATVDRFVTPAQGRTPAILIQRLPAANQEAISEKVNTVELGYRLKLSAALSIDVAAFHSKYEDLQTGELGGSRLVVAPPAPYVVQSIVSSNQLKASSHGIEISAEYQIAPWWRLQPSYSYLDINATAKNADPANQANALSLEAGDPRHQMSIRSSMTFAQRRQFDLLLRYVSPLRGSEQGGARIPGYTELDVRYAWRLANGVSLSLGGQNLLKRRHAEFTPDLLPSESVAIERNFYVKAKWQY